MLELINLLPGWVYQLLWSAAVLFFVCLMGNIAARLIRGRLSRLASKTAWQWDDVVLDGLKRGLPFWSLLYGFYVATGFWNVPFHAQELINRALYIAGWFSFVLVLAGLAGRIVGMYGEQFQHALPITSLTQNLVKIIIFVIGVLTILNGLGISVTPILTALGVGGLAVALALQDTLSNLFAGFYLTVARQVRIGDYIKLDSGQEGHVVDIGWRSTQIRMLPNNLVVIPNNKLSQAVITNFDLPSRDLAVTIEIGVDYASDLEKVERVTVEVARDVMRQVSGGVGEFEPVIRYHTLGSYSIQFTVVLMAKTFVDQYLIKHEFIKRLVERYRREGITIPFPVQTVLQEDRV